MERGGSERESGEGCTGASFLFRSETAQRGPLKHTRRCYRAPAEREGKREREGGGRRKRDKEDETFLVDQACFLLRPPSPPLRLSFPLPLSSPVVSSASVDEGKGGRTGDGEIKRKERGKEEEESARGFCLLCLLSFILKKVRE